MGTDGQRLEELARHLERARAALAAALEYTYEHTPCRRELSEALSTVAREQRHVDDMRHVPEGP